MQKDYTKKDTLNFSSLSLKFPKVMQQNTVNIRPGVSVLSVLPHLNYKAWFALAEFVDNSIQSSIENAKALKKAAGTNYKLRVDIHFDASSNSIAIIDNAAGISVEDYQRAFRPAEIPPDATGLSEFGMGMKSAACWFAPTWSVRTSALGENIERTVVFNIDEIVHDSTEELDITTMVVSSTQHYTEIRLDNIRKFPKGNTVKKIIDHLSSIYRIYIQEGKLSLHVDGNELTYTAPKILRAPSYKEPDGEVIEWKKDINFDLGDEKSASGFVAIRETANTRLAGLAIFRRKRLILGSADETYRPEEIFGRSNTYPYQRLFGEIHLKGFFVSHTKDGIKWEESEEEFLKLLREEITKEDFPLLQQAREHRTKQSARATRDVAAKALNKAAINLQNTTLATARQLDYGNGNDKNLPNPNLDNKQKLDSVNNTDIEKAEFNIIFRNDPWKVVIELSYSENFIDWLSISNRPSITDPDPREVTVRIAMLHPFMAQFPTLDSDSFTAVIDIAAAMALAEVIACEIADNNPAAIRRLTNDILKEHMSKRINDD